MVTRNTALLFEWGDPRNLDSKHQEWIDYLQYGFSEEDVPSLIELLLDEKLFNASSKSKEVWVCLHAWRILGQLKSSDAIEPIISILDLLAEDDWALTEIPTVIAMIGETAIIPMNRVLLDDNYDEFSRIMASDSLSEIAQNDGSQRLKIIALFREYLLSPDPHSINLNGLMVCGLIDIQAVELIDEIRSLYQHDYADITIAGDLEDVEIALGLRHKRETPKPHYGLGASNLLSSEDFGLLENLMNGNYVRDSPKIGRNDPCFCGSGKKYKHCCLHC